MLLNDIDISTLMVYAQQIDEPKIREIRQEGKRSRSDDSGHQKPKIGSINKIIPWETRIGLKTNIPKVVARF